MKRYRIRSNNNQINQVKFSLYRLLAFFKLKQKKAVTLHPIYFPRQRVKQLTGKIILIVKIKQ